MVPKVTFFKEKLKAYWNFRRMGGVIKKIPLYRSGVLHPLRFSISFQHWLTKATVCLLVVIMRKQESIIRRPTMLKRLALKHYLI